MRHVEACQGDLMLASVTQSQRLTRASQRHKARMITCLSLTFSLLAIRLSSTPIAVPRIPPPCKIDVRPFLSEPATDAGQTLIKEFLRELDKSLGTHGCKTVLVDEMYDGYIRDSEVSFSVSEKIPYGLSGTLTLLPGSRPGDSLFKLSVVFKKNLTGAAPFPPIEVGPVLNTTDAIDWYAHEIGDRIYYLVDTNYKLPKPKIYSYCFRESTSRNTHGRHLHSDTLPAQLRTALAAPALLGQDYEVEAVDDESSAECPDPESSRSLAIYYRYAYIIHGRVAEDDDGRQISLYVRIFCTRTSKTDYRDITLSVAEEQEMVGRIASDIYKHWKDIVSHTGSGGRPQ
jgi:hypothetical protein